MRHRRHRRRRPERLAWGLAETVATALGTILAERYLGRAACNGLVVQAPPIRVGQRTCAH